MNAVEVLLLVEELEPLHVPGDVAGVGHDLQFLHRSDQPLLLLLEIPCVGERQAAARLPSTSSVYFEGALPLGWKCPAKGAATLLGPRGTVIQHQMTTDSERCAHCRKCLHKLSPGCHRRLLCSTIFRRIEEVPD